MNNETITCCANWYNYSLHLYTSDSVRKAIHIAQNRPLWRSMSMFCSMHS